MRAFRVFLRRVLRSPIATLIIAAAGAVAAAAVKQALGKEWDWISFWQDVAQNAFVAVAITFLTAYVVNNRLRRQQAEYVLDRLEMLGGAVFGWDRVPGEHGERRDVTETIAAEAKTFRQAADAIDGILDRDSPSSDADSEMRDESDIAAYLSLSSQRFGLVNYLSEGARKRRPVWARLLIEDLATLESAVDDDLARSAHACRLLAMEFTGWVLHTDTVITERLVVERTTPILGSSAVTERLQEFVEETYTAHPASVLLQIEPMYLLIHHLWSADQAIGRDFEEKRSLIPALLETSSRCLGAFRNELRIAAELADGLVGLVQAARSVVARS